MGTPDFAAGWQSFRLMTAAAALGCAAAIAFMIWRLSHQSLESMDFRYIWVAGRVWADGQNPYSPDYGAVGLTSFPTGYPVLNWVYPFHWFPVATALASLSPGHAFAAYIVVITIGMAVALGVMTIAAVRLGAALRLPAVLLGTAFVCTATPLTAVLHNGQPAGLSLFGVALTLFGMTTTRPAFAAIGVALALLKPHLGLPAVAAIILLPGAWRVVVGGGMLVLLGSVPAFLVSGMTEQIAGLIQTSHGGYQATSYNSPAAMPGLAHWIYLARIGDLSISVSMVMATMLTFAAGVVTHHWPLRARILVAVGTTVTITATIVGLHGHDLAILLFGLPFLPLMAMAPRAVAIAGYCILWRAENVARVLGSENFTPTLQSTAALLVFGGWLALIWSLRPSRTFSADAAANPA